MGENNSKWNNWQRIHFQNIQAAHTTQCQKNKQPDQKVGKRPKQIFLQRRHQMSNKHMKSCSTSLIIREIQIKTTMRYHLTPVRMAIIKKSTNNKCWRGWGEKGTFLHCWWECKLIQPLWKTVWRFLKKLGIKPPYNQAIPLLGIYPEETKIDKNTCKDAQHHSLLEKCKSKLQWDITSYRSKWRSSNLQTINAGEGVEKRKLSYTYFYFLWDLYFWSLWYWNPALP